MRKLRSRLSQRFFAQDFWIVRIDLFLCAEDILRPCHPLQSGFVMVVPSKAGSKKGFVISLYFMKPLNEQFFNLVVIELQTKSAFKCSWISLSETVVAYSAMMGLSSHTYICSLGHTSICCCYFVYTRCLHLLLFLDANFLLIRETKTNAVTHFNFIHTEIYQNKYKNELENN